jgi:hypothetical protein
MNTETVSEKPKRRRPPLFNSDAMMRALYPEVRTTRSIRNKQYLGLGLRAICTQDKHPSEQHPWIFRNEGRVRQAVLVELGRIAARYGAEIAKQMADRLEAEVAAGELVTTREAAAWLRNRRLSVSRKPSKGTATALESILNRTIVDYLTEHPDMTGALVQEALCGSYGFAEWLADKEKKAAIVAREAA